MPLQEIKYKGKLYLVVTQNKLHEKKFRKELSIELIKKYGLSIKRSENITVLKDMFNFFSEKLSNSIREIKDITLIIFIYQLHEQSAELSYYNQDDFEIDID